MKDLHKIYTVFKKDFPAINAAHEALGEKIHKKSGPLPEKLRWLIKIAISGASRHHTALQTHIRKARDSRGNRGGNQACTPAPDPDRRLSNVHGSLSGIQEPTLNRGHQFAFVRRATQRQRRYTPEDKLVLLHEDEGVEISHVRVLPHHLDRQLYRLVPWRTHRCRRPPSKAWPCLHERTPSCCTSYTCRTVRLPRVHAL